MGEKEREVERERGCQGGGNETVSKIVPAHRHKGQHIARLKKTAMGGDRVEERTGRY